MTRDQKSVVVGAASGTIVMGLSLWLLHWLLPDPDTPDIATRLAYALKWDAVAALPLLVMIVAVGNARFSSEAIDPTLGRESPKMIIDRRALANTLEQFALFLVATLALAVAVEGDAVRIVGAAAITFVVMRLAFWIGYRIKPVHRAFGFASTAYMNIGLLLAAIWLGFN